MLKTELSPDGKLLTVSEVQIPVAVTGIPDYSEYDKTQLWSIIDRASQFFSMKAVCESVGINYNSFKTQKGHPSKEKCILLLMRMNEVIKDLR